MQLDDYDKFDATMQAVASMYGKEMTPGLLSLYWQGLRHLDLSAIQNALNRHIANPDIGQFMPKIADVNRMLGGTTQDAALMAWAKVDRAVRQVGTYEDVVFDDPLIHRVIADMGGWVWFGLQTEEEWPFIAKQFENRYRGYKSRNEVPDYRPVLTGMANSHNSLAGFKTNPPRLLGDPKKAQAVLNGGTDKPLLTVTQASDQLRLGKAA